MENPSINPELEQLKAYKDSGYNYRERRHEDWKENYTLYRDKVTINRLTQRQSVNVPLMKQTIRTLLKDVDDMPVIEYQNRDNDKQKEIFQNEYWKWTVEQNKLEIKDIVDKKQVFLFGRSFDQMQVADGMVKMTIVDPQDILVDRYCDPTDIDSSRFLIHTHIFVPLSQIEKNDKYDKQAIADLKQWYLSDRGMIKASENRQMLVEKNQKLADMGVSDVNDPTLGETIVELTQYFVYDKKGKEDEQLYFKVEADNYSLLLSEPLEKSIGITKDNYWRTHFPYNTWADDIERQDFWSDGIADIVRTPNKILNSWISQLVENRTLRNFGMHYYNSSIEGFSPQTFNPIPWGWYPIPMGQNGRIDDVIKKVEIPDLSEALDEMQYVVSMVEKATGATATQQGAQTERQITLGEVQLALGEAKERIKGMSKFYTQVWKERAHKFLKLIEASSDKLDSIKIFRKGKNNADMYMREISPKDYMTDSGYTTKIWSQDDKNTQDTKKLERLNVAVQNMPGNMKLVEEFQRALLEFADLAPEKINEIIDIERQKREAVQNMAQEPVQLQPGQTQVQLPINQQEQ